MKRAGWAHALFPYKIVAVLYEKAACPFCQDRGCLKEDLSKRASRPSHINTTTILQGNKA